MSRYPGTAPLEEYWDWFAAALFVLISVDMITTMHAAWYLGVAAEANPLMRWALGEGLLTVTLVNLAAILVAVGSFYALLELLEATEPPHDRYIALSVEVWLGLLFASGLFIFANNLYVIFHGHPLLVPIEAGTWTTTER